MTLTEAKSNKTKKPVNRQVKTPTILQMEVVECGAASLSIVLAYYGRYITLEQLREDCGISRDGSKASNIIKAARKHGLNARGYRYEPEALRNLTLPMIIHWKWAHFVVLEGFGDGKVYLNDPSKGRIVVTDKEFDINFTGVSLVLEPTSTFEKVGRPFSTFRTLLKHGRGSEKALWFIFLIGLSVTIPGLLIPGFIRVFIDFYLIQQLHSWLYPLLLGMLITATLRGCLTWLREYYLLRLETKLAASMSSKFLWHILRLPMEYYFQRHAGEIVNRIALNDQVATLLSGKLASAFLDIVTAFFFALLMFVYDPTLTLVGIFIAFLNFLVLRYVSRRRVDTNQQLLQERGKLIGVSMGGLRMIETLKSVGREKDFFIRWSGYQAKINRAEQKMQTYTTYLAVVPPLLTAINTAAILVIGGFRVVDGVMTVGMLVAFQSLMTSFLEPVNKLVEMGSTLQDVQGSLKRLGDVFDNKIDVLVSQNEDTAEVTKRLPKLSGQLEIRDVTFGYNKLEPALIHNFSLTLKPGSRVALVGASGSGKSTVAKLVAGLYQPWKGEIFFDGKARQDVPRTTINNSLSIVDQDIFMFEGTARDNLTMWDPTVPEYQVVSAAKDACIHEEIASRSGGYHSEVAENGGNYSGGQRQRLEIARALANNPVLLVLDEATSALDPITERNIDEQLRSRGCSCLIIAHRLSTIRDCDEIIVLEKGRIVQRGTHQELKEQGGVYARLIES